MSGADERYTDPATGVLRNRLGIQNAAELEVAEAGLVAIRMTQLRASPLAGAYDFQHLLAVHRRLFADLYDWAGQARAVQTAKGRSMFPPPHLILPAAQELFGQLAREQQLRGLDHEQLIDRLAHYLGETHAIHPFREGNSRSARALFGQLARQRGLDIPWDQVPWDRMEAAKDHAMHNDASKLRAIITDYARPLA